MTYHQTKFNLTKNQLHKIATAVHDNTEVTLRLSKVNFSAQGCSLPLTNTQLKTLSDGNYHDIKLSLAQIKHISNKIGIKNGGFLPLIPIIAAALGGISAVAGTVANVVQKQKANNEQERHNKELENKIKSGTGKTAKGLYLKAGTGLRL